MGMCIELEIGRAIELQKKKADMEQKAFSIVSKDFEQREGMGENGEIRYQDSDMKKHKKMDMIKRIEMTLGFNQSDGTFGWDQYRDSLTMYYLHPREHFIQKEHSFPLVPGLTPLINVESVQTTLLGADYSITHMSCGVLL